MQFLENLVESRYIHYTPGDHNQVITSVRPTEEFDLEIHNFVESREYKASKNFCLDMRRQIIDTRAQIEFGKQRRFCVCDREADRSSRRDNFRSTLSI